MISNVDLDIKASRTIKVKEEYGDWQTSEKFACAVCSYLKRNGVNPKTIFEPTCGKGHFIKAALSVFDSVETIIGVEIYKPYIAEVENFLIRFQQCNKKKIEYKLFHCDIFDFNFKLIKEDVAKGPLLILGNPPWITNSDLGRIKSKNLPVKCNYKNIKGIEAITGKGNFDIAESICNLMFETFGGMPQTRIALLLKNSVIKNIVTNQNKKVAYNIADIKQVSFDARREFGVSVPASLFCSKIGFSKEKTCQIYDFYTESFVSSFGWNKDFFVSNLQTYENTQYVDGRSQIVWRSGLKHDCAKVMELTIHDNLLENGFHESVDVESEVIYPFLKSSDIGNGYKKGKLRKYVVLPQKNISEDVELIKDKYPKTYQYFLKYKDVFNSRKSIIYKNKPQFSVFGLGEYSFQRYKIVVSALYKSITFSLVTPINDKIVLLDDTCYMLGFDNLKYASITLAILNSEYVQNFISTISFCDAKRIISRELLMRIDLLKAIAFIDLQEFSSEDIASYKQWLQSKVVPALF